jgi:hypothetical protein
LKITPLFVLKFLTEQILSNLKHRRLWSELKIKASAYRASKMNFQALAAASIEFVSLLYTGYLPTILFLSRTVS